ncbi:MAG: hypothetical protein VX154_05290 [Pseudomonadota bacterium]|nr:hypothetical protein [Pseudomonadota bacterium]
MTFNPEMWVTLSSVVVAVCALVVTIWQGRQNYKHNKMSVKPILVASEDLNEVSKNNYEISCELINTGFGPAIIKEFILIYDGKEVSNNNRTTFLSTLKKLVGHESFSYYWFAPDSSISAGEAQEVFAFNFKKGDDISFLEKLNVKINYQSIYGDEAFTYDSRKDRLHHGLEGAA